MLVEKVLTISSGATAHFPQAPKSSLCGMIGSCAALQQSAMKRVYAVVWSNMSVMYDQEISGAPSLALGKVSGDLGE